MNSQNQNPGMNLIIRLLYVLIVSLPPVMAISELKVIEQGSYSETWGTQLTITGPAGFRFRWVNREISPANARWIITNKEFDPASLNTIATAPIRGLVAVNNAIEFTIDFQGILPSSPPKSPYSMTYYVYVIPMNPQGGDMSPSNPVRITYQSLDFVQPELAEEMGSQDYPIAKSILEETYTALKDKFAIQAPIGEVLSRDNLPAYRLYSTPFGTASIEVYQTTPDPTIYVCVPNIPQCEGAEIVYHWFKYTVDRNTRKIVPDYSYYQYPPPEIVPPVLQEVYDTWGGYFGSNSPGDDPPHWTPIIVQDDAARNSLVTIENIHRYSQNLSVYGDMFSATMQHLRNIVKGWDLTDRAEEAWQSVTVRGYVPEAWYPDGDYAAHHTTDYHDEDDTPVGGEYEAHDHDWPGLDWDMLVFVDEPYKYLCGPDADDRDIRVEIEHFALGDDRYWPYRGDWLQATGRWVTDNGHEIKTEIHPPELLVASSVSGFTTTASVIVTGAWLGHPLTFVVNPPPRPSPTAKLKHRIIRIGGREGYERKDNADLIIEERGGPGNPNHLFCKVVSTQECPVFRYNNSVVGMCGDRGLQCIVECGWDEPFGVIEGDIVSKDGGPAKGALMFYRDASIDQGGWRQTQVDAQGHFSLPPAAVGSAFWLRPAGSGWNFKSVPRKLTVKEQETASSGSGVAISQTGGGIVSQSGGGLTTQKDLKRRRAPNSDLPDRGTGTMSVLHTFIGTPDTRDIKKNMYPDAVDFGRHPIPQTVKVTERFKHAETVVSGKSETRATRSTAKSKSIDSRTLGKSVDGTRIPVYDPAMEVVRSMLIHLGEPSRDYGVKDNGMGYKDHGTIMLFHLKGLTGWDNQPVKDPGLVYTVDNTSPQPSITVNGTPNGGVVGATIRAELLLGNPKVGYHSEDTLEAKTDGNGSVAIRFGAGTHPENAVVVVEVVENPYNPWFLPKVKGSQLFFHPSKTLPDIPESSFSGDWKPYQFGLTKLGFSMQGDNIVFNPATDAYTKRFLRKTLKFAKYSSKVIEMHNKTNIEPSLKTPSQKVPVKIKQSPVHMKAD